jgi:two-component system CheB/CheR fusion protein
VAPELQHVNDELHDRSVELDNANAFLEAVLTSLRAGVTVLNREMHVRTWNRRAEDLWGLRQHEAVGQHFLNLDIGLPTDQLRPLIRKVLNDVAEPQSLVLQAVNRRGRTIGIRVVCTPLNLDSEGATGAILVMEPTEQMV